MQVSAAEATTRGVAKKVEAGATVSACVRFFACAGSIFMLMSDVA